MAAAPVTFALERPFNPPQAHVGYSMLIHEAVQLTIQGEAIGEPGEVLVLGTGEPKNIAEMARTLIRRSSKKIPIIFTGWREDAKMHEDLLGVEEIDVRPKHPFILQAPVPAAPRVAAVPVVTFAPAAIVAPAAAPAVVTPAKVAGTQVIATPENATKVLGEVLERPVAFTGANSILMALAGLVLFGIGAVLLLGARRRQSRTRNTPRLR